MNFLENNIKYIIFDMDGTLIDSMSAWDDVGEKVLLENNKIPEKNLIDTLNKMTFDESAKYLIENYNLEISLEEIKKRFYEIVKYKYENTIYLKEGVEEFLEKCKKNNIKMAILTASNREISEIVLKRLDILKYFEFIMTTEEENLTKKDEGIYIKALKKLNSSIKETAIFEDMLYSLEISNSIGIMTIGVFDKSSIKDIEKIKKTSNLFIYSFKDLI
ncbi:HAD family hydrolase [Peptoniphilus stercorisuis]|uniref:HAD superfamily phosphoserine phosphatase-like hydrolase n=1 Tax=Peptoniphilus stercorisuis TaxID=1436965 RepID=A0ABS4KAH2_9FIRM|nr:HAD family phosphatase [Peptoniphilus stercorisuis]MBP2024764.1 HAD superfamily phosphoserine phosphatase-like hydrolase [Peptoniphilus stercorisuis]